MINELSVPNSVITKIGNDWLTKTSEQSFKLQWIFKLIFTFLFWDHNNLLFWHQINRKKLQLDFENSYISGTCHLTLVSGWINYFRSQEVFWATVLSVILFCEYVVFLLILLKNCNQFSKADIWHSFTINTTKIEYYLCPSPQLRKQEPLLPSFLALFLSEFFYLISQVYIYSFWSISRFLVWCSTGTLLLWF